MKKRSLVFAAFVLLMAGCRTMMPDTRGGEEGFDPEVFRPPNPVFPNVFITSGGNILVDQEPIRLPRGGPQRAKVTWSLAAKSPYTFPDNGITIDERMKQTYKFACVTPAQRKVITCTFDRPPSGRALKYAIRVKDGVRDLPELDPTIIPE